MEKSPEAFRTISEVAAGMELPQHVLRFWETRFPQIKPLKRGGGRRYYRPDDVELLRAIRRLLYDEGYTIKGVQKLLREQGAHAVIDGASAAAAPDEPVFGFEPVPASRSPSVHIETRAEPLAAENRRDPASVDKAVSHDRTSIHLNILRGILVELREAEAALAPARSA